MRYEGMIYRPPSEANSLILQVTIGCCHNKCTFCSMYKNEKFRIRDLKEIFEDLEKSKLYYGKVKKVFLADGDALCLPTETLKKILLKIKEVHPYCNRIGIYATAKDVLKKSEEELKELNSLGLGIVYMGLETGSAEILEDINKGVTVEEYIQSSKRLKPTGIKLSITIISGLGGKEKWEKHAIETGKVVSLMDPEYVGLLTLLLDSNSEITKQVEKGEIILLKPKEIMQETKLMLENMNVTNCVFRSNHASNYVALGGTLPYDKEDLIYTLDTILKERFRYKKDKYRSF
ncbi:B12-binding domain-containing radical SAM protein [Clostridium niameyense]|uniref:B12-binding domain-containing radical SAM protein n=1 Tax=Clostridium niameyense TaxID=1622073 RepID=A0A6M0RBZ3_9CLOT|nr:radical SAM protein [Clostridium niameyense]NEZ47766.1 B12-binding domain-containing radical SAM protein [Clostridium niameyense]